MNAKRMKYLLLCVGLVLAALLPGFYNALRVQRYKIDAAGIDAPVRIALISDLHSCRYGEGMRELIDAVDAEAPDLIALTGDIFDDDLPDDNAEIFLRAVSGRYPCWYVTGNHEYWAGREAFARKMAILEDCGVKRLSGEAETIDLNSAVLTLCGVDDPASARFAATDRTCAANGFEGQLLNVRQQTEDAAYTILLCHRPESFDRYAELGFDLVLSGHAHGGQWRVPGILNGVFAPDQGVFPRLAGGLYQKNDTTMIVSRGLARESTRVPRIYNRPELVIIDLE